MYMTAHRVHRDGSTGINVFIADQPRLLHRDPTGAILVRGDHALLLVPVEFRWCPMSEAALRRYRHTAGMHRGETWTFLTRAPVQRFEVQMAEPLSDVSDVARLYGAEAASRANPNQATVQVRLSRR
jgi:hypothetical protein